MPEITVTCDICSGTGDATHGDRHTSTNMDRCRKCGGEGKIPARPGESRETSWPWAVPEAAQARLAEEAKARHAGVISILEERVKAATCYFRDGAAVRTGVLPDHASHIAEVLQSLLAESVPPRAAEPASDALTQARRLAADLAEERFRGDLAALFMGGAGDDHPWVALALRGLRAGWGDEEAIVDAAANAYRSTYLSSDSPDPMTLRHRAAIRAVLKAARNASPGLSWERRQ